MTGDGARGRASRPSPRRSAGPLAATALSDTLFGAAPRGAGSPGPPPAGAWTQPAYDDGAWGSGAGPLGFGETRIVTTIPDGGVPTNRWITATACAALRRRPRLRSASCWADYDDGFVAWLNGVEIARRGPPTSNVVWSTLGGEPRVGAYETIVVTDPPLRAGDNVLAIELHPDVGLESSDPLWDAALLADTANVARTRGPYLQNAAPTAITVLAHGVADRRSASRSVRKADRYVRSSTKRSRALSTMVRLP